MQSVFDLKIAPLEKKDMLYNLKYLSRTLIFIVVGMFFFFNTDKASPKLTM